MLRQNNTGKSCSEKKTYKFNNVGTQFMVFWRPMDNFFIFKDAEKQVQNYNGVTGGKVIISLYRWNCNSYLKLLIQKEMNAISAF